MAESEDRQELAEDRTDWAHERTLLAKQRTVAAWFRTGLGAVAVGIAAAELLGDFRPRWVVLSASTVMVLTGAVILVMGLVGYRGTFRKLQQEGVTGIAPWVIGTVTTGMVIAAGLLLYAVLS